MTKDETRLRAGLTALADDPPPANLTSRILDRAEFAGGHGSRPGDRWRIGATHRAVLLVAAAVVAIVVGTTAIVVAQRSRPAGPATVPTSISAASPSQSPSSPPISGSPAPRDETDTAGPGQSVQIPNGTGSGTIAVRLLPRDAFPALDVQQTHPCAGERPVPRADIGLLIPGNSIAKAIVCSSVSRYSGGRGLRTTVTTASVDPTQLRSLTAELTATDRPAGPNVACDRARLVLDFVVYLQDGTILRPGAPMDGCSVRGRLIQLLQGAHTAEQTSSSLLPDKNAVTGCLPGTVVGEPFSSAPLGGDQLGIETAPTFSVCRYSYDLTSGRPHLAATGSVDGTAVAALTSGTPVVPSKQCAAADIRAPASSGFLAVAVVPTPTVAQLNGAGAAAADPVVFLELGGCHRLLSGDGTVAMSASAALIAEIAPAAIDPVPAAAG